MEHIAISVIVPIYNTKPYLAECIESILAQKINVPIEVLLIDDGSTDGCGEVCDKYAARDERVRVIHQENQGLSAARNAGIDAAKGRYYSFIDSDDVVLPRFLQTLYDACEEHDAYMSLCSVEDVQEDGKSCDPAYFTRPTQEGVFCGKDLLNEFYTPYGTVYTVAWNKMYRAEVWKLLHYPEGRLHEDDFVAHRLFWRCDKVVAIAQEFCDKNPDTLLIVTGDHTHSISVIGTVDDNLPGELMRDKVGIYAEAGYPAYKDRNGDGYPDDVNVSKRLAVFIGNYPDYYETYRPKMDGPFVPSVKDEKGHYIANAAYKDVPGAQLRIGNLPRTESTGVHSIDDLVVGARGPHADAFRGFMNSTEVFRIMSEALALGNK